VSNAATRHGRAVTDAWGIEIYDYWGCSEGVYAFPCEAVAAMHLPDDLAIIEPADRNGDVVAPSQPADKVLLTNLCNRTQPPIRWEITDAMAVVAGTCECGCALRRITDLAGRTKSSSTCGEGVVVRRLGTDTAFLRASGVVEYRGTRTPR
jgi:phenylacetate-coenzyme A ligase PaaK-like adenylate-forming protein